MGAVGGFLGLSGGAGGTGFNPQSGTNQGQINTAYNNVNTAMQGQQGLLTALQGQNGLGNQTQNYNQLQNVISGNGPNPAQAMLNQSTGANVANQAALMAGQRGAGSNVGLMARQAAQTGAGIQQQAAGQGATMQAQQALGAMGQAGQMANTMAGQQIGQTNQNVANQQNEQNILQGANTANSAVQGQLANTSMGAQQSMIGGAGNAAGSLMGLAGGGEVGPQSMFGQSLMPTNNSSIPNFTSGNTKPMNFQGKKSPADPMAGATDVTGSMGPDIGMVAAKGGQVPVMLSPGEIKLTPEEARMVAEGRAKASQVGEKVPGKAKVAGDDYANDTHRDTMPEGGVVVKRTKAQSDKTSADFVRAVMAKKKAK